MNKILYKKNSENPKFGMILIHGRGATADDIMQLADVVNYQDFIFAAPQAPGNTWYPFSFLAPVEQNEPWLSGSLNTVSGLISELENSGISREKIILAGFSQGACLILENIIRNPAPIGGIAAFSGAAISMDLGSFDNKNLNHTPVFLGCSQNDPHIPLDRIEITAKLFQDLGADVVKNIYPGSFHGINEDELKEFQKMIEKMYQK